jgi:hypothetical protein
MLSMMYVHEFQLFIKVPFGTKDKWRKLIGFEPYRKNLYLKLFGMHDWDRKIHMEYLRSDRF